MKHEWRKHEKDLYGARELPRLINCPRLQFIMIKGKGNPNNDDFSDKVSALFSLAYAIKMLYKNQSVGKDIEDYTVYPLEAIWKSTDNDPYLDKSQLEYTAMIRQPDFITENLFLDALERVKIKKPNKHYSTIYLDTVHEKKCIDILHIGSYDNEPVSFQKMDLFAKENHLIRLTDEHREIYLTNKPRVLTSKLKTILRFRVD